MIIKRLNDPYILNIKIELEGARTCLQFRNRLQAIYKKEFNQSQRHHKNDTRLYSAMIAWNKLYINKLLKDIDGYKKQLGSLYESERKILYMEKRRELPDQ